MMQPDCRLEIFGDRTTSKIDPRIYGMFAEHLGRCIYGGILDEGSPLADADGFRNDVIQLIRELRVPAIRWPGGLFASYYHWQDGIGPIERRPRKLNLPWKQEESNRFGTDEFIRYCGLVGAEPQFVVNCISGTPDEAAAWVEYCNCETNTHFANLRRACGNPEPFGIKTWELDNEVYHYYPQDAWGAKAYADHAFKFAKAMKLVDPSIELIACGLGKPDWDRAVLERLGDLIDHLAVHAYVGHGDSYQGLLGTSQNIEATLKVVIDVIETVRHERKFEKAFGVAFNEYNIVRDWKMGHGPGDHRFEYHFNLRDALWLATVLNALQRLGEHVRIASYSQIVNVVAPIMTSPQGAIRQTHFFPLHVYRRHCGDRSVDCRIFGPTFRPTTTEMIPAVGLAFWPEEMPFLDVSVTVDSQDSVLTIIGTNLHADATLDTEITIHNQKVNENAEVFEITGRDLDSRNTFEQPDEVNLAGPRRIEAGKRFRYDFPPRSITVLKLGPR